MAHFALISPPFLSHIRALEAVGEVLIERGHRVTFLHQADVAALIRQPATGFCALGATSHPTGSLAATVRRAARPGGPIGLLRLIHDLSRTTDMLCRDGPSALREIGATAMIADQMEPAGGLLAEALRLPYVSVASALAINREPAIPPPFLSWAYDPSPAGLTRNRGGERVSDLLMSEHRRTIARWAQAFGLPPRARMDACFSPFAQVSQAVAAFDFPRSALPAHFHHVGPLRPAADDRQELDWPIRDDKPLVFASLGTLQGGRYGIFRAVAQACRELDAQLLVAHCGGLRPDQAASLGATWVTDFAPQRAVLRRADVLVTHAGLNTVLDALSFGVPMLALPIAFDQPGVAARLVRCGAGLRLTPRRATAARVRRALEALLLDGQYRARAASIGIEVRAGGGAKRAADIVEAVVATGRAVAA